MDFFELGEVHQREGKGLVPADGEDINADLATCREEEGQRSGWEGQKSGWEGQRSGVGGAEV